MVGCLQRMETYHPCGLSLQVCESPSCGKRVRPSLRGQTSLSILCRKYRAVSCCFGMGAKLGSKSSRMSCGTATQVDPRHQDSRVFLLAGILAEPDSGHSKWHEHQHCAPSQALETRSQSHNWVRATTFLNNDFKRLYHFKMCYSYMLTTHATPSAA